MTKSTFPFRPKCYPHGRKGNVTVPNHSFSGIAETRSLSARLKFYKSKVLANFCGNSANFCRNPCMISTNFGLFVC